MKKYLLGLFVLGFLFVAQGVYGATAGANFPDVGTEVGGPGSIAWSSEGNISTDDTSYSTSTLAPSEVSEYLQATDYDFSIPTDAIINGISVTIGKFFSGTTTGSDIRDSEVRLIKGGSVIGDNDAQSGDWSTSSTNTDNYGSSSDLWGTSWTASDINATNFGVALSARNSNSSGITKTANVDYIKITVTYTILDGAGTMSVSPSSSTVHTTTASGFDFTFKNNTNEDFTSGSMFRLTIPSGWTAPQTSTPAGAGYISIEDVGGSGCSPGSATIAGSGPWTIDVPHTCGDDQSVKVYYDNVTTHASAGTHTFTTLSQYGASGLTNIASQPDIDLNNFDPEISATLDGGTAWLLPTPSTTGSSVTVAPSATIDLDVTVLQDSGFDWGGTCWWFDSNPRTFFNHTNHTSAGTYSESISITAPSSTGAHTLHTRVREDSDSDCGSSSSEMLTMTDAVVVSVVSTGSLNVTKTTIGGNGTFSFSGTGFSNFDITTLLNAGSNLISNLAEGNYTVNETAQTGWDITSNGCTDVEVSAGNTTDCTITNTKRGSITVTKNVVAPDGETDVSDDTSFSITMDGGETTQSIAEGTPYTYSNLLPGTYTITEIVPEDPDFDLLSIDQDSDSETTGSQVVVEPGANVNVTITNKQKKGKVIVNKVVTNPNGGEAVAGDFSFKVNDGMPMQFMQNEENSNLGSYELMLNPGMYSITEVIPEGAYAISYTGSCVNITVVSNNETQTCTITNSDIPEGEGAITVVKSLPNDDGGEDVFNLENFPLKVTSVPEGEEESPVVTSMTTGESEFFMPGSYVVAETNPEGLTGFTQSISCTDGETVQDNGNITLSAQQAWVCTITNDDKPAKLTIIKNTVNSAYNGTLDGEFTFNVTGQEGISITTTEGTGQTMLTLDRGSYSVTENLVSGWNLAMSCGEEGESIENGFSLSLANGEEVTCTFTNTRQTGTLLINKTVVNDHEGNNVASDFSFRVNDGAPIMFNGGEDDDSLTTQNTLTLEVGTRYNVTEPEVAGYDRIVENNCRNIEVMEGETKTCDIINNDLAPSAGNSGGGSGGQVLGAETENTSTETSGNEEKKEEEKKMEETPAPTPEPTGEVLGEEIFKFLINMKVGSQITPDVSELQKRLTKEGHYTGPITGKFGKLTREAVIKYQKANPKLTTDGYVGPRTRGVLNGTGAPIPNSEPI